MSQENPCQCQIRRLISASPTRFTDANFPSTSTLTLSSFFPMQGEMPHALPAAANELLPLNKASISPCCFQRLRPSTQSPHMAFFLLSVLTTICMRLAPKFICLLRFFCYDPHLHTTPDWKSLPRCFAFQILSNLSFLPIFPYLQRCYYHLPYCPQKKYKSHSRPMLPKIVTASHMCY